MTQHQGFIGSTLMTYDRIFSIIETNAPREGMTISEYLSMAPDAHASIFSLGRGTDIGTEMYPRPFLYIALWGTTEILKEIPRKLTSGEGLLIPAATDFAINAGDGCIFLEIESTGGFNMNLVKNDTVFALKDLIPYEDGKIVNADIINNAYTKLALMSFDAGTATPVHAAPGEALVTCLEGEGIITDEGIDYPIHAGENFTFRPGTLHKVTAVTKYKMTVLIIKRG